MINVQEFLRSHSVEELNRSAEEYFARITDWTYLLAKPFAAPEDCAKLLIEFWASLKGLEALPTMEVLDFGPGSCWTSYFLTQMGCKVYACDVSASALEIGKARYQRHPPFGNQPPPEFLVYDGFRIPLPDKSVDRVLCMHALHHVPNVSQAIAEMGRVLRDRGTAAFSEPGPNHSKDPVSQQELENGVLENDIVMEDIGAWATAAGFKRLELAAFPIDRVSLSPEDYGRFIAGDHKIDQVVLGPIRRHAEATRTFFLHKDAKAGMWSTRAQGLACKLEVRIPRYVFPSGSVIEAEVSVQNTGQAIWIQEGGRAASVNLGFHLKNLRTGEYFNDYGGRAALDPSNRPIEPGGAVRLQARVPAPGPGSYELTFDLVSEWVCWFGGRDPAQAVSFRIEVTEK